jgi:hypothetical protein
LNGLSLKLLDKDETAAYGAYGACYGGVKAIVFVLD